MQFIDQHRGVILSTQAHGGLPKPWKASPQKPLNSQLATHMAFIKTDLDCVKSCALNPFAQCAT